MLVGGAIIIVALVVAGGSVFTEINREGTDLAHGWPYLLVGGIVGLLVGVVSLFFGRKVGFRPYKIESAAILILFAAVGALVGLAFAPRHLTPDQVSPLSEEEQRRRADEYSQLPDGTIAGPIDLDGDGLPDLDINGLPVTGLDIDGDGVYDKILVACPPGSPTPTGDALEFGSRSAFRGGLPALRDGAIVDTQCDGTVERVIPQTDEFLDAPSGGVPGGGADSNVGTGGDGQVGGDGSSALPRTPTTISPQERQDRADDMSLPSLGKLLKYIAIGLGIIVATVLLGWLLTWLSKRAPYGDAPDLPQSPLPPPTVNPNFQQSIEDLINDPDPRNGILAAYGRLLIGFDQIGLGRLPHEGPNEHLDRALAASDADPVAAKELTAWFATARFSDHPISEADRQQAIDALRRVTGSIGSGRTLVTAGTSS